MPHDLALGDGTGTPMLDPGESVTQSFGVMSETTQAWCTVPGHKESGMVMDIIVEGAAPAGDQASAGGHGAMGASSGSGAEIDFAAKPDGDWKPFDPTLAPAPGGTNHEVTWHMTEEIKEIAPGVTQEVWTFNGQVPGPTLRGKLGDIFTVTIVNDGKIGHSLDFHASKVAWNDEMRTIQPGESLVYQFEAKHAGAFMYHCGTAPTLHHIGNGMHGAIVIDPPDLAPVDHEYLFVQHEYYTGAEGEPGDLTKMQQDAWDAVVFNGYVNQYAHTPIDGIEVGERVRAWIVDNGPSENSSWHVVGTVFDTLFKEGAYQLRPDASRGGAQALDLQPAQGGFVEFTFDEEGVYPFVSHKFSNASKGAMGLFVAGNPDLEGIGGH
jgi:nitrite reductase (NO-forming)